MTIADNSTEQPEKKQPAPQVSLAAPNGAAQIIDPAILPFDGQHVRYQSPDGARRVRVKTILPGFASGAYREPGDVFDLFLKKEEPLPHWVQKVAPNTPLQAGGQPVRKEIPAMSHMSEDAPPASGGSDPSDNYRSV